MKKINYTILICFIALQVNVKAQSNENYIYKKVYQEEVTSSTGTFVNETKSIQEVTYFDGLGRPKQKVGIDQSASRHDIITHIEYDDFGRMEKEYLPYDYQWGAIGSYRTNAKSYSSTYYNTSKYDYTTNPYSEKSFYASPLNRVEKLAAPGESWEMGSGHEIEMDYGTNTNTDNVKQYGVSLSFSNNTYWPLLTRRADNSGRYTAGDLFKKITKDENHTGTTKLNTTEEYTDKLGNVVLKRTYNDQSVSGGSSQEPHDTYYVYDDFGKLTFVLSPEMNAGSNSLSVVRANISALGYKYVYDNRNRLVEKQIPGKAVEYMIYNKLDQPIMTQDGNQRASNKWTFTKYDVFGRVAYTGIATDSRSRQQIQTTVNNLTGNLWVTRKANPSTIGGASVHYNNGAYPTSTISEVHTIEYYDDYDFNLAGSDVNVTAFGVANSLDVKGLSTGNKVKVLDTNNPNKWITTVIYYDEKGREIYTYIDNDYLETTDIVEKNLDFVGKPNNTSTKHIKNGTTLTVLDNFTYDHAGRNISHTQCISNDELCYECYNPDGSADTNNESLPVDIIHQSPMSVPGGTYEADRLIQSNITFTNTSTVNYEAGKCIQLLPGFLAPHGKTFSGTINGSGNNNNNNNNNNGDDPTYGGEELIALNSYDELGQLISKKVGGTVSSTVTNSPGLQTIDYDYNVRNWLTSINDADNLGTDLFGFQLHYDNPSHNTAEALFNGNISQANWATKSENTAKFWYIYHYDALNRINSAQFAGGGFWDRYSLHDVTYDKNGNITHLRRNGWQNTGSYTNMDNLTYTYSGNKLISLADGGNDNHGFIDRTKANQSDEYTYDTNGNMKTDYNKGITNVDYNFLNLPTKVSVNNGTNNGNIKYVYDAVGIKQRKIVSSGSKTDYAGNYIYKNDELQFYNHPEGYVEPVGSGYHYVYQYKDHLDNIRLSYADRDNNGSINADTEIIEEFNYYPFGLKHNGYNNTVSSPGNSIAQKFGYNGKEFEEALGLNYYEMDKRIYDPAIGRWSVIDPKAYLLTNVSPYVGMHNNPTLLYDPSGEIAPAIWAAIVYALETGGETAVDIALGVTLSYLTGVPYGGWNIAADYFTNLIPGWGEARSVKRVGDIGVALTKSAKKFNSIEGGGKIYKQVKKGLDEFKSGGDINSLKKIRGALYEFKLINSLDNVVGAGSNARQIAKFAGLDKNAGNLLNSKFGDVTLDVVQKTKDGVLNLVEAKTGKVFSTAKSFAGLGKKALKQIRGKIDFAKDLNAAGVKAKVEFRFSDSITSGLLQDIVDYARKNDVNVKIVFD